MMKNKFLLIVVLLTLISCKETPNKTIKKSETISSAEWETLSKINSLEGWHIFQNESNLKSGWTVEDGVFTFDATNAKGEGNKSLLTNDVYSSFEIMFEWKLSAKSNSGFMWGVSEDAKYEHPYLTGPEIQILDAEVYRDDPQHQRNTVGALYDMSAPSEIVSNPAGSWNKYHITVNHNKNEAVVILNEIEINRFPLSGPEWDAMISNSKFKDIPSFAKYKEGHLSLQDHPGVISYKNIKIRRL